MRGGRGGSRGVLQGKVGGRLQRVEGSRQGELSASTSSWLRAARNDTCFGFRGGASAGSLASSFGGVVVLVNAPADKKPRKAATRTRTCARFVSPKHGVSQACFNQAQKRGQTWCLTPPFGHTVGTAAAKRGQTPIPQFVKQKRWSEFHASATLAFGGTAPFGARVLACGFWFPCCLGVNRNKLDT